MPEKRFQLKGVCAREAVVTYDDNGVITNLMVVGGCNGNLKGICSLVTGMKINDVITKLDGIKCVSGGRGQTSCPDQIAKGLQTIEK